MVPCSAGHRIVCSKRNENRISCFVCEDGHIKDLWLHPDEPEASMGKMISYLFQLKRKKLWIDEGHSDKQFKYMGFIHQDDRWVHEPQ